MEWLVEGKLYIGRAASLAQGWEYVIPGGYQRNYGAFGGLASGWDKYSGIYMDALSRGHSTARGGILDIRMISFSGSIEEHF